MALATDRVARTFLNIVADTPVNCDFPLFATDEVVVIYGKNSLEATLNTDFTVQLASDFEDFTVTPLASLLTKINDLIAADATETNYITVRRKLDLLTAVTPETVRNTPFLAKEIDRIHMRLQQLQEEVQRSLVLPESQVGEEATRYVVAVPQDGRTLIWDEDNQQFIVGPDATEIQNAQTYAEQANAALDNLDDRWLGAKAADPTVDNDGNPLVVGAVYFNTGSNNWRYWNGSSWNDMSTPPTIADGSIVTAKLADGAVTGAKIASQTITNGLLANQNINFNKLNNNAVLELRQIPQIELTANRTLGLDDAGHHIYHPASDTVDRTVNIPNDVVTDLPIGSAITIYNDSPNVVNIAIFDDTLVLVGTGTTGPRVLAQYGQCTILKVDTERWIISGIGIS